MEIGDKYKIESDNLNIIVSRKERIKKTNKDYWRNLAYFSTPQNALNFLVDLEVRETELKDITTVIKKQDALYELIKTLKGLPEIERKVEFVKKPRRRRERAKSNDKV